MKNENTLLFKYAIPTPKSSHLTEKFKKRGVSYRLFANGHDNATAKPIFL